MTAFTGRALAIVDVGHGNAAVVQHDGWVAVIDAGPGSALLEFLKEQGISTIDEVLLSHADEDHIAGLVGLLASDQFRVVRVRANSDALKGSRIWDDLLRELDRLGQAGHVDFSPVLTVAQNGEFDHDQVRLEVMAPSRYLAARSPGGSDRRGRKITTNSASAVIAVTVNDTRVALFGGDIDQVGVDEMLDSGVQLRCAILVFPHHGGTGSVGLAEELVRAAQPRCVVFSIGRGRHKTPVPDLVAAVLRAAPGVHVACTQLSEHCASATPKAATAHLAPVFARGRESGACCAGTVLVDLDRPADGFPDAVAHRAFIAAHAPTALCARWPQR